MPDTTTPTPPTPKRGGRRPNSGRRRLYAEQMVQRNYKLPTSLAEWADAQGGAAYVRHLIEHDRIKRRIV